MKKWHVNRDTGEYGRCKATVQECPVEGDVLHTTDLEEAIWESETALARIHEPVHTTRKTPAAKDVHPQINYNYPCPLAHNIDNLDTIVHSLKAGEVSSEVISSTGVVETSRSGDYFGEAAVFLGLADAVVDSRGRKAYSLTRAGEDYVHQDTAGRQDILKRTIENIDLFKDGNLYNEEVALQRVSSAHGENLETAKRKLNSLRAWDKKIQSPDFLNDVDTEEIDIRTSEGLEEYRRKYPDSPQQPERAGEVCQSCFMEKPLTGICPNCDE